MLRRSTVRRAFDVGQDRQAHWTDSAIFGKSSWTRWWKRMSQGNVGVGSTAEGGHTTQYYTSAEIPRSLQGFMIQHHPGTEQKVKYFPLKDEFVVDDEEVPSFQDILHTYYWPKMPSPNDRARYIAAKRDLKVDDVAAEMYRRRRLRLACAQQLRFRFKNRPFKAADPPNGKYWDGIERAYLKAMAPISAHLGSHNFSSPWLDPHILYSPQYKMGVMVDCIIQSEIRTSRQFGLMEIVTTNTLPKQRIPSVKGTPKEPLHNLEPSFYHEIMLKLSVAACLAKDNGYVVDNYYDGGHNYRGVIIHVYEAPHTPGGVGFDLHELSLDMALGYAFLADYEEKVLSVELEDKMPVKRFR